MKLFQQVQFVNFYIYMTCRLQKPKKKKKNGYINQEVKHLLFQGKYRFEVVKVKDCKIKQEGAKTFQKRN